MIKKIIKHAGKGTLGQTSKNFILDLPKNTKMNLLAKNPDKGTVQVKFTNGAGNNIFQYVYSRLLAEKYGLNLSCEGLDLLDIPPTYYRFNKKFDTIKIDTNETDFHQYFKLKELHNFIVYTYPEDYTIYKPHLDEIRTWFKDVPKTNNEDLVFHLRLGDRLLYNYSYDKRILVKPEEYLKVIERFKFNKLYIVTDMKVWRPISAKEVEKMEFHVHVPKGDRIDPEVATSYFNSLYDSFLELDPIVRINYSVKDDFNFMRSFDKILFQHGTLSWWAAALSHASQVGVFGPWRPTDGKMNKNLGKTDFLGWFSWGNDRV